MLEQRQSELIALHANLHEANATALEHASEELENPLEVGAEPEQSWNSDGCLTAGYRTLEDARDSFEVEVIRMELKGATVAPRSAPIPPTPAKSSRKKFPEGRPGVLNGLKVVFTGTFDLDRDTCVATAKRYGATVQGAPSKDTDYVFLGARAGWKKLEVIEQLGLETVDEAGFFELLKNGLPQEKQDHFAARSSAEPAQKKQKKQRP
ncbi:hypothetical protein LTR08_003065 [Meristemomyces frigidus]|nr:hypothetical protein LTR08_003065 [Meristemomyces frigidus]